MTPTNRIRREGFVLHAAGREYALDALRDPAAAFRLLEDLQPYPAQAECALVLGLFDWSETQRLSLKGKLYDLLVERGALGTHAYVVPGAEPPRDHLVTVTAAEWSALQLVRDGVRAAVSRQADNLCWMDLYRDLGVLVGVPFDPQTLTPERMLANCAHFVRSVCTGTPYRPDAVGEVRNIQEGMTDGQRLDLWADLRAGYCAHCGRALAAGESCHCGRDE